MGCLKLQNNVALKIPKAYTFPLLVNKQTSPGIGTIRQSCCRSYHMQQGRHVSVSHLFLSLFVYQMYWLSMLPQVNSFALLSSTD